MRITILFLLILNLGYSLNLNAKNHILILGGSGDPAGEKTIFDSSVENISSFVKDKNYNPTIVYNGGHSGTEQMLAKNFKSFTPFNAKTFKSSLETWGSDFKSGDKAIIFVNSHGEPSQYPRLSHPIHCGNELCELNDLNEKIKSLEQRGVQVALIDASCYSGSSVQLGSEKTCVMTASRSDSVGYSEMNRLLSVELKNPLNKNLEDVFLKAYSAFFGQGEIKTSSGARAKQMLAQFYSEFKNPKVNGQEFNLKGCRFNLSDSLENLKKLNQAMTQVLGRSLPEFDQLSKALKNYDEKIKEAQGLQIQSSQPLHFEWISLLSYNEKRIENEISQLVKELNDSKNPTAQSEIRSQIEQIKSIPKKLSELRKSNSQFQEFERKQKRLSVLMSGNPKNVPEESLFMAEFRILESERKLFTQLYEKLKEPNACSNFSL